MRIIIEDTNLRERIDDLRSKLPGIVGKGLKASAVVYAGIVQRDYLQGPRPERLGVQSTRLIGSIQAEVEGMRAIVSANARSDQGFNYPRYWEVSGKRHGGPRPFLTPPKTEKREEWESVGLKKIAEGIEEWAKRK